MSRKSKSRNAENIDESVIPLGRSIKALKDLINDKADEVRKELGDKTDGLRKELSELSDKTDGLRKELSELSDKVDEVRKELGDKTDGLRKELSEFSDKFDKNLMEKFRQGLRDESWQQYTKERSFDRFSAKSSSSDYSDHSSIQPIDQSHILPNDNDDSGESPINLTPINSAPRTSFLEENITFDNFNERFDERFPKKFDEMFNQKTFKIQINESLNSLDT